MGPSDPAPRPGCQRPRCPNRGRYSVLDAVTGDVVTVCGAHMAWLADVYDIGCRYLVADVVPLAADTAP